MHPEKEKFIRYQNYFDEHYRMMHNLFIFVAVATLGFQINLAYGEGFKFQGEDGQWIYIWSIMFFVASIISGIATAVMRFVELRLTISCHDQAFNKRDIKKAAEKETRARVYEKGKEWGLAVQLLFIAIGFILTGAFFVVQHSDKFKISLL